MAAQFGVSRPLLREALAELRAEGFVETVSGRGTFVRHPSETDLADAFAHQLLLSAPGPADGRPTLRGAPGHRVRRRRAGRRKSDPGLARDAGAAASRDDGQQARRRCLHRRGRELSHRRSASEPEPAPADAACPARHADSPGHVRKPRRSRRVSRGIKAHTNILRASTKSATPPLRGEPWPYTSGSRGCPFPSGSSSVRAQSVRSLCPPKGPASLSLRPSHISHRPSPQGSKDAAPAPTKWLDHLVDWHPKALR